ncbi:YggS family pyridoxal phosphate-dependent enzyme [Marinomonas aquiplantarum]|uniref:Pyridoxal phosphate homeostasis protein n=1 Tax=Marinomonas aquiplantarum TaxID=491951 RepID=A0A366D7B9_9GAMM|nr:YggS family pyridoxal phosphate-dependent enzyme [Marinomonas aquiplantarum]RBO85937.1 hypothetical protein DFP76_101213 [Marinomonas aquiplantarum]
MTIDTNLSHADQVTQNLSQVRQQVEQLAIDAGRDQASVRILAVSKTKPLTDIQAAYQSGQRAFGENYVQEAFDKYHALAELKGIEWHFIGPIQSNKTRQIAESMDWVHSIDREKIARRLSEQRPDNMPTLQVCIQVNISGEESKSGILLEQLPAMVELVQSLPNLQLRGLMAIPAPQQSFATQCQVYQPLQQAFLELSKSDSMIDTLSIGMSADLPAAISSGSTMVRVGTAIFGARDYAQ